MESAEPQYLSAMKNFLRSFLLLVLACGWVSLWAKPKMNVLFIPVDDLNHWVGYTGRNPQAKTPNIDRLSRMGVSFSNAHCSAPACEPTRASLFSGLRPSTSGCYLNGHLWKKSRQGRHMPERPFQGLGLPRDGHGQDLSCLGHEQGGDDPSDEFTRTNGTSIHACPSRPRAEPPSTRGISSPCP